MTSQVRTLEHLWVFGWDVGEWLGVCPKRGRWGWNLTLTRHWEPHQDSTGNPTKTILLPWWVQTWGTLNCWKRIRALWGRSPTCLDLRVLPLPDIQRYYKTLVIQTESYRENGRQRDHWSTKDSPENKTTHIPKLAIWQWPCRSEWNNGPTQQVHMLCISEILLCKCTGDLEKKVHE